MNLLYAGSFDPFTYGHFDIVRRAAKLADILYVGVGEMPNKNPMFDIEERLHMVTESIRSVKNAKVLAIQGLTADTALALNCYLVRGLRNVVDFTMEQQMGSINHDMVWGCETIYLMGEEDRAISSTAVRELWKAGASEEQLLRYCPPAAVEALMRKRELQSNAGLAEPDIRRAYQEYLCRLAADANKSPETAQEGQDKI